VDQAQEARVEDENQKLKDKHLMHTRATKTIEEMCKELDCDGNGKMQEQEFIQGFDNNEEIARQL